RRFPAPREGRGDLGHRLEHLPRPPADAGGEGAPLPAGRARHYRHRDRRGRPPARGAMSRGWLAPGGGGPAHGPTAAASCAAGAGVAGGAAASARRHALGPARDLLVTGANVVDVVTHAVYRGWFTVLDGRFVEVEEGDGPRPGEVEAAEALDLGGAYVQPGMLDVNMHIESSLVTPRPGEGDDAVALDPGRAYGQRGMLDGQMHIESSLVTARRVAEGALSGGTTTVLQDAHALADVLAAPGIMWMVEASPGRQLRVF